jgi:hypothetical protein
MTDNGFHSQGPVGDFEGLLAITWDPKEKNADRPAHLPPPRSHVISRQPGPNL